ncbi:MAG: M48 family metalloprotease [Thermoplasmata archaeon]|nr:M48 family metalloprotease [Thermoplasmata archaeon]
MTSSGLPLLALPVLLWAAMGLILLVSFHRTTSERLLRLAATFVALWALLATTALLWVLTHGGWGGLRRLVLQPLLLLDPAAAPLWLWGAVGTFFLLLLAFLLNQAVGRGFLLLYEGQEIDWPRSLPRPTGATTLRSLESSRPEAFSFTLVELDSARRPRRREVILLSSALLARLDPEEVEAVIAHELGHIRKLDSRYLTFFRTFARLMRWDPVLASVAGALTHREELEADRAAVRLTGRPAVLALALEKLAAGAAPAGTGRLVSGLFGSGGAPSVRELEERIGRLRSPAMGERGALPSAPAR